MDFEQLDLFDFESKAEMFELPSLADLQKPKPIMSPPIGQIASYNYRIGKDDELCPKGIKSKIKANIVAIKLLKELEAENQIPQRNECRILTQYSGWGGLSQVFVAENPDYAELKNLLTEEEYNSARASTLNSHYTPKALIEFMWRIAEQAGITEGEFGEFGAGIGHFIGLMPDEIKGKFIAVEIDDISGRIMKQLYPNERIIVKNLQKTVIAKNSLDLVIGNVPFDQVGVHDSEYIGYNLHNYFIARTLDALKPGGIAILLTSSSTMDSKKSLARENFASKASLLTAIRLPNNAFEEAGTEVVADILVFQKGASNDEKFIELMEVDTWDDTGTMLINEYFHRHPEQIWGVLSNTGRMYGKEHSPNVLPIGEPIYSIPEFTVQQIKSQSSDWLIQADASEIEVDFELKEHALFKQNGKIYRYSNSKGILYLDKNGKDFSRNELSKIFSFIEFKNILNELLTLQLDPYAGDSEIESKRQKLNQYYYHHTAKYGNLNNRAVHRNVIDDPDYLKLAATENVKKIVDTSLDGIKTHHFVYEKGDIYLKRTQFPWREPETAEDIVQAGMISYAYRHNIDIEYVAQLMNFTPDQAKSELLASGEFFENPIMQKLELKSEYLSGNVVQKLQTAKTLAPQNIEALKKVQPTPLRIEDIDFQLGSFWIETDIVSDWLEKSFDVKCKVYYLETEDRWNVEVDYRTRYSVTDYRVEDWDLFKLVECALNLKEPVVYDEIWDAENYKKKKVVNQEATLTARQFKNELQDKFRNFILDTPEYVEKLETVYNRIFNSHITRTYELPHFDVYPGAVSIINGKRFILRNHQKRAVSRCIEGNTLLAHCVGAGKTAIMVTAAMELKRLKLATKTLIVVQNATLQQFAEFAPKLYPGGQILIADKKDLIKEKRKSFMARIATGDWDMVIMAHSSFDMIKDSPELVCAHYEDQISELETVIRESEGRNSIKELERQKKRLVNMLDKLNDKQHEEDIVYFDELGIDSLIIDEAHAYKRNFFPTKMERVKGLDRGASQRAFSLTLKIRSIMEKTNGRNIYFATGTPVTNTIAELWNMVRYISPNTLREFNIETFDRFASVFTETETALEIDAASRFKMVTRFCKYANVIELSKMFRTVADVVLSEDLEGVERPPIKGGRPEQIQITRSSIISRFMDYLCDLYEWFENSSDKRKISHIPLLIYGMSRKITIDPRLIHQFFPDDPHSKLNIAAKNILTKYHEYASINGTQIVFCDLYRNGELFNAWEELKRKLISGGISANEVAVISDYKTDKQKAELYEQVNSGNIRVVIGSTTKLGTGVNIQERLAVAHHLDCPFRPSDVEQRDGRIIRQGNILEEVEIIRYGVEQTLDAGMYAILERKQKFINDALKGRCARSVQEINDDCALDYASFSAAISGNPKLKRKVVIETRLKELDALERQHRRNLRVNLDQQKMLTKSIPMIKEQIIDLEKFIAKYSTIELGNANMKYGDQELTGTLTEKAHFITRKIDSAIMRLAQNRNYSMSENLYPLENLTIGGLTMQLIVKAAFLIYGGIDDRETGLIYRIKGADFDNLPVKVNGITNNGENLFNHIRRMITDKPDELIHSRIELEAKIAKLKKLDTTKPDEFSVGAEKSTLTVELDKIIFELNKNSEGQRDRYTCNQEPLLSDYFDILPVIKQLGDIEIEDGEEESDSELLSA